MECNYLWDSNARESNNDYRLLTTQCSSSFLWFCRRIFFFDSYTCQASSSHSTKSMSVVQWILLCLQFFCCRFFCSASILPLKKNWIIPTSNSATIIVSLLFPRLRFAQLARAICHHKISHLLNNPTFKIVSRWDWIILHNSTARTRFVILNLCALLKRFSVHKRILLYLHDWVGLGNLSDLPQ